MTSSDTAVASKLWSKPRIEGDAVQEVECAANFGLSRIYNTEYSKINSREQHRRKHSDLVLQPQVRRVSYSTSNFPRHAPRCVHIPSKELCQGSYSSLNMAVPDDETNPKLDQADDGHAAEETGDISRPPAKSPDKDSPAQDDQCSKTTPARTAAAIAGILTSDIGICVRGGGPRGKEGVYCVYSLL